LLRRIFGPKRDEIIRGWRELHNKDSHNVYSPLNVIRTINSRRIRWEGNAVRIEDKRYACGVLVGKLEGKRPLRGMPRRGWQDNIRMDFRKEG
jgi:hypothetical protein